MTTVESTVEPQSPRTAEPQSSRPEVEQSGASVTATLSGHHGGPPGVLKVEPASFSCTRTNVVGHLLTALLYMVYLFVGCLFYVSVEEQPCDDDATELCRWSVLDAVYFLHVTMSTVGYGDLSPSTVGSQVFTLLYIFVGILVIFSRLADVMTGVTQPLFNLCRTRLEQAFPQDAVDIDGDGIADFKVPRHPLLFFGKALLAPIVLVLSVQCGFAGVFVAVEPEWSYWEAFYHCLVTATTVGYGDMTISRDSCRVVAIFQILFSVASIAALLNDVVELQQERKEAIRRADLLSAKLDPHLITSLDTDGKGVDKFEFVIGMLVRLELVAWDDVHPLVAQFNTLDADGSGRLTHADLETLGKEIVRKARAAVDACDRAGLARSTALTKTNGSNSSKPSTGLAGIEEMRRSCNDTDIELARSLSRSHGEELASSSSVARSPSSGENPKVYGGML